MESNYVDDNRSRFLSHFLDA